MTRNSSWTGRAPRTVQQAFGPHTSREMQGPVPRADRVYGVLLATLIGIAGALLTIHWAAS